MARVNISYFNVKYLAGESGVIDTSTLTYEEITSSATSQATTTTSQGTLCRISTDGNIKVVFGNNPTATATSGFLMQQGSSDLFWLPLGTKVAVVDV